MSNSSQSYYDVLGIPNNANESDIKRAYRSLSLKYHPDRNKNSDAVQHFQQIGEAYEVLSDPFKKSRYDAELNGFGGMGGGDSFFRDMANMGNMGNGSVHFTHTGDMGGMPPELNNIFNMVFGRGGMGGMESPDIHIFHNEIPFGGARMFNINNLQRPPPIIKNINITLEQAYNGVTIPLKIERKIETNDNIEKETIYVDIPAGTDENEIIILRNNGHIINENNKGDIKVIINIENHSFFQRHGIDIMIKKQITLKEALCGFSFEFIHLNGKKLCINNNSTTTKTIIKPLFKKIIPNMGMVRNNLFGNMIIEFDVEFPNTLTEEQINKLEEIL
jgi:DnaJ-class molecular chaperone